MVADIVVDSRLRPRGCERLEYQMFEAAVGDGLEKRVIEAFFAVFLTGIDFHAFLL